MKPKYYHYIVQLVGLQRVFDTWVKPVPNLSFTSMKNLISNVTNSVDVAPTVNFKCLPGWGGGSLLH